MLNLSREISFDLFGVDVYVSMRLVLMYCALKQRFFNQIIPRAIANLHG